MKQETTASGRAGIAGACILLSLVACTSLVRCAPAPPPEKPPHPAVIEGCEKLRGYARVTLKTTERRPGQERDESRSFEVCVVLDGGPTSIESGPKVPYQTVSNGTVTTGFKPAGLGVTIEATRVLIRGIQGLWVSMNYEDSHILEQADIPVMITKIAMIDTTKLTRSFLLKKAVETPLAIWTRGEGSDVRWSLAASALWDDSLVGTEALQESAASEARIEVLIDGGGDDVVVVETASHLRSPSSGTEFEFVKGRQAPLETTANGTSTWAFKQGGTTVRARVKEDGSATLTLASSRFSFLSSTTGVPQLFEDGTEIRSNLASNQQTPVRLGGLTASGRRLDFVLRRFSLETKARR